ncbi:MAG TPA: zinc-binding dehydrogenase, partial [Balneolaceae bacterium]|nr:zinc-binding dehydrogenase [Balneolaceae bacterium]
KKISLAPLLRKRLKIMGSTLRSRSLDYKINLTQSFLEHVQPLLEKEIISPVIDRVFDWKDTEEAHQFMDENKNTGKIVLTGM